MSEETKSEPSPSSPGQTAGVKRKLDAMLDGEQDGEMKRQFSKKQRKSILAGKGTRQDFVDFYGKDAVASLELKLDQYFVNGKHTLKVPDIQSLVLWVLGEAVSPKWIFVKNKPLVDKVVWAVIDGLSQDVYTEHAQHLPSLTGLYDVSKGHVPLHVPTSMYTPTSVLDAFLNCSKDKVKGIKEEDGNGKKAKKAKQKAKEAKSREHLPSVLHYLLSEPDMKSNKYPLDPNEKGFVQTVPAAASASDRTSKAGAGSGSGAVAMSLDADGSGSGAGSKSGDGPMIVHLSHAGGAFVEGKSAAERKAAKDAAAAAEPRPQIFAVDCEMCYTSEGLELTRVTLINEAKTVLMDNLVKPRNKIVDYNTQFSGIDEAKLRDVTTTIEDVQQEFLRHVSSDAVLVGHSMENDLMALKVVHRRIIDTALLYPHPKGPPLKSALRYLTKKWLRREIQKGNGGHNSFEDASAALDLTMLKVSKGPDFGLENVDTEPLFRIMERYKRSVYFFGSGDILRKFALPVVNALPIGTDAECVEKAAKHVGKQSQSDLLLLHLRGLQQNEQVEQKLTPDLFKRLDAQLKQLHDSCPRNTMLIVTSGQGPSAAFKALQARKLKHQQTVSAGAQTEWTEADEASLKSTSQAAFNGVAFFKMKH